MAADSHDETDGVSVADESSQSVVPVGRAFRESGAVEFDDGMAVAGAIRIRPAAMSMVDDITPPINRLAGALAASNAGQGAFVAVQRSVDYEARRDRFRALADRRADREDWAGQMQADLAAERAAVANLYQETSTTRDHYLVVSVTAQEAAETVSDVESSLASVPVVGTALTERRVDKLREDGTLTRRMVDLLDRRCRDLADNIGRIEGVTATPISSAEYVRVIADYYRGDDMYAVPDFDALVHQSPVPEHGDPEHETSETTSGLVVGDDDDRQQHLRSLCAPRSVGDERDGSISVDGDRVATIAVSNWPERPAEGFLEPLYRYSRPGVDVAITTHWDRVPDEQAKKEAKNQENSLEGKLEGDTGDFIEDYVERKYAEASEFTKALEVNDHGVFDAGLFVTVRAPARGGETDADPLEAAIEDITVILREECGFDTTRLNHRHEDGWQTTAPLPTNQIGTNVTIRGMGLARQFPYQYRNLQESGGIRVGVHEYLAEPTVVDVFGRGNGYNGGIYGMIGSGKTTTMQEVMTALKLSHDAQDEPFKLVFSTPLQDFQSLCEAFDGKHIVVGGETAVNPLEIRHLDPAKLRTVGEDTPWKDMLERFEAFLASYYELEGLVGFGEKVATWKRAAKHAQDQAGIVSGEPQTYANDAATLRDVIGVLEEMVDTPGAFVREALEDDEASKESLAETARTILQNDIEAFGESGKFEHFTRESTLDVSAHDVIYLDLQRYESDEDAGGLMMQMLLSDIYEQLKAFDGNAFLGVDEFHYMLRNRRSQQFFEQTHRHSRHWDLACWLATQNFGDLFTTDDDGNVALTDSADIIMDSQAMQLYQYTKEMDTRWGDELDLSNRSQSYISDAATGKRTDGYAQALLVVDEDEYPLRVEMSDDLNPRAFSLYEHDASESSGHPPVRQFLREYETADGADPCNWRWS